MNNNNCHVGVTDTSRIMINEHYGRGRGHHGHGGWGRRSWGGGGVWSGSGGWPYGVYYNQPYYWNNRYVVDACVTTNPNTGYQCVPNSTNERCLCQDNGINPVLGGQRWDCSNPKLGGSGVPAGTSCSRF